MCKELYWRPEGVQPEGDKMYLCTTLFGYMVFYCSVGRQERALSK